MKKLLVVITCVLIVVAGATTFFYFKMKNRALAYIHQVIPGAELSFTYIFPNPINGKVYCKGLKVSYINAANGEPEFLAVSKTVLDYNVLSKSDSGVTDSVTLDISGTGMELLRNGKKIYLDEINAGVTARRLATLSRKIESEQRIFDLDISPVQLNGISITTASGRTIKMPVAKIDRVNMLAEHNRRTDEVTGKLDCYDLRLSRINAESGEMEFLSSKKLTLDNPVISKNASGHADSIALNFRADGIESFYNNKKTTLSEITAELTARQQEARLLDISISPVRFNDISINNKVSGHKADIPKAGIERVGILVNLDRDTRADEADTKNEIDYFLSQHFAIEGLKLKDIAFSNNKSTKRKKLRKALSDKYSTTKYDITANLYSNDDEFFMDFHYLRTLHELDERKGRVKKFLDNRRKQYEAELEELLEELDKQVEESGSRTVRSVLKQVRILNDNTKVSVELKIPWKTAGNKESSHINAILNAKFTNIGATASFPQLNRSDIAEWASGCLELTPRLLSEEKHCLSYLGFNEVEVSLEDGGLLKFMRNELATRIGLALEVVNEHINRDLGFIVVPLGVLYYGLSPEVFSDGTIDYERGPSFYRITDVDGLLYPFREDLYQRRRSGKVIVEQMEAIQ